MSTAYSVSRHKLLKSGHNVIMEFSAFAYLDATTKRLHYSRGIGQVQIQCFSASYKQKAHGSGCDSIDIYAAWWQSFCP